MGSSKSKDIAKMFNLSGRVDLYHAFLVGIPKVLSEGALQVLLSLIVFYLQNLVSIRI